jgi:hypothetical protein
MAGITHLGNMLRCYFNAFRHPGYIDVRFRRSLVEQHCTMAAMTMSVLVRCKARNERYGLLDSLLILDTVMRSVYAGV